MEKQYYLYQTLLVGELSFSPDYAIRNLKASFDLTDEEISNDFIIQLGARKVMKYTFDETKISKEVIDKALAPYTYTPLNDGEYQDIVNDYNVLLEGQTDPEGNPIPNFDSQLTQAELIQGRQEQYDTYTHYSIVYGFKFNNGTAEIPFKLNKYDQMNFSELAQMQADGNVTFPRKVYTMNKEIYELVDATALLDLIEQIRDHVNALLTTGWTDKETISNLTLTELKAWTDSRKA